jgi:hypothetical protein
MKAMRQQKSWMALLALVFLFASCKGESPTAPPTGGGGTGGGGTPPTGTAITLTASNSNPVVDSIVLITAAVTVNGQPAPDGTAVEFAATGGSFSATETVTAILRTTVNGIATVQLRSTVAGTIRVQAAVGSVSRTVDVLFRVTNPVPPPDSTAPSITSVTPTLGIPSGGERIQIIGKNFKEPVRVLFDTGGALPVEAFVVSRTDTLIEVLTPSVNLGAGQQLVADVIVITQAGTANEARAELSNSFTFRAEVLTPRVTTTTPNSGPVTGGTRVTIFGDGFQAPVQVLFGAAEARVVTVEFSQIIVEAPAARDTSDNGSGTVTGPVSITVRNINSATEVTLAVGFRYVAAIDITSFRPLLGPATGGTDVVIDGIGFLSPVDVSFAGQRATVLQVTGTRILARTSALASACAGATGVLLVTNVNNGDFEIFGDAAEEDRFQYVPVLPLITSISPIPVVVGGSLSVTVRDPGVGPLGAGDIRFTVNDRTLIPNPDRITTGSGFQTFSVPIPVTGFTFPSVACTTGSGLAGTQFGPTEVALTFNNLSTSCSTTTTISVAPNPLANPCLAPPEGTVTDPVGGGACPGATPAPTQAVGGNSTDNIRITNRPQSQPLNITAISVTGPNASAFTVAPTTATGIVGGGFQDFTVTFNPDDASGVGPQTATVSFTTNSPTIPTINVCVTSSVIP